MDGNLWKIKARKSKHTIGTGGPLQGENIYFETAHYSIEDGSTSAISLVTYTLYDTMELHFPLQNLSSCKMGLIKYFLCWKADIFVFLCVWHWAVLPSILVVTILSLLQNIWENKFKGGKIYFGLQY
jgi:hypothetical protein